MMYPAHTDTDYNLYSASRIAHLFLQRLICNQSIRPINHYFNHNEKNALEDIRKQCSFEINNINPVPAFICLTSAFFSIRVLQFGWLLFDKNIFYWFIGQQIKMKLIEIEMYRRREEEKNPCVTHFAVCTPPPPQIKRFWFLFEISQQQ